MKPGLNEPPAGCVSCAQISMFARDFAQKCSSRQVPPSGVQSQMGCVFVTRCFGCLFVFSCTELSWFLSASRRYYFFSFFLFREVWTHCFLGGKCVFSLRWSDRTSVRMDHVASALSDDHKRRRKAWKQNNRVCIFFWTAFSSVCLGSFCFSVSAGGGNSSLSLCSLCHRPLRSLIRTCWSLLM